MIFMSDEPRFFALRDASCHHGIGCLFWAFWKRQCYSGTPCILFMLLLLLFRPCFQFPCFSSDFWYHIDGLLQDLTPLLTHWSYIFMALTHQYEHCHLGCGRVAVLLPRTAPVGDISVELLFYLGPSGSWVITKQGHLGWASTDDILLLWCQKQVSRACISNYILQYSVGCNYLSIT